MVKVKGPLRFLSCYRTLISLLCIWITTCMVRNDVLQTMKTEKHLKGDDYREFVELCIMFLGSAQTTVPKFKQPGAIHKARC